MASSRGGLRGCWGTMITRAGRWFSRSNSTSRRLSIGTSRVITPFSVSTTRRSVRTRRPPMPSTTPRTDSSRPRPPHDRIVGIKHCTEDARADVVRMSNDGADRLATTHQEARARRYRVSLAWRRSSVLPAEAESGPVPAPLGRVAGSALVRRLRSKATAGHHAAPRDVRTPGEVRDGGCRDGDSLAREIKDHCAKN